MFVAVVDGAEAPPGVPAAITTTGSSVPSRPAVEVLSRGRSLGLSAVSLGGLVIIWSKAGSGFELDCNLRREDDKEQLDEVQTLTFCISIRFRINEILTLKSTLNFFKLSICFL